MKTELIVALVAGAVAIASAIGTFWSSSRTNANALAIKRLEIDNDNAKVAAQHKVEMSRFREPLARSVYDLQSRLHNILKQNLIGVFLMDGDDREKTYVINNTVFLIAQFQYWSEQVRCGVQFINLDENKITRELTRVQDSISGLWGTDAYPPSLRIFAGEQRVIGEALIQTDDKGIEQLGCIGYGAFLKRFTPGVNPLIDALRSDVGSLGVLGIDSAAARLKSVQNALIDLLVILDPEYIRFPADRRTKV